MGGFPVGGRDQYSSLVLGLGYLIHRRQQPAQFLLNVVGDEFLLLP